MDMSPISPPPVLSLTAPAAAVMALMVLAGSDDAVVLVWSLLRNAW